MNVQSIQKRTRALAYLALALLAIVLLVVFRQPILHWFTGARSETQQTAGDGHDHGAAGAARPAPAPQALPDEAAAHLRHALGVYDEIRKRLAADRAGGLAPLADSLGRALTAARAELPEGDAARHADAAVAAASQLGGARDLATARRAFAGLSQSLITLGEIDPRLAQGSRVLECSMTSGFNRWIQRPGQVENPYQGKGMLTCGTAVAWPAEEGQGQDGERQGAISHYTCPMHPTVRQSGPGQCPICGMDLVPVTREEVESGTVRIDPARRQEIGVRTGVAEVRPLAGEVRAVGRVAFDESRLTDVTVRFGGYIDRLLVDETGQYVKKGQTLFTLYSPELYAAQQEYLVALGSQRQAQGTAAPDRADYLVAAARQKLRLWDLPDWQIQRIARGGKPVEHVPVAAPASGYVVEKDVVAGAAVSPGMRLYRIAGLDRVWVEAEVFESELPRVRPGQAARVSLPYAPGEEVRGRVSLISPALSAESRTGRVRIELPNRWQDGALQLRPDMYADVVLEIAGREALVVPESAILYAGTRRLVFLDLGEGRFRPREVTVGAKAGDYREVLSGLSAGDPIVVSGNFLIAAESRLKSSAGLFDQPVEGGGR